MLKRIAVIVAFLLVLALGYAMGDGSYKPTHRDYTQSELSALYTSQAIKESLAALRLAYISGVYDERGRCEQIYDVQMSTETR